MKTYLSTACREQAQDPLFGGEEEIRTLVRPGVRLSVFKTVLLRPLEYLSIYVAPSQPDFCQGTQRRASLSDSAEASHFRRAVRNTLESIIYYFSMNVKRIPQIISYDYPQPSISDSTHIPFLFAWLPHFGVFFRTSCKYGFVPSYPLDFLLTNESQLALTATEHRLPVTEHTLPLAPVLIC